MTANLKPIDSLPDWVPPAVRMYLSHTEDGLSLRAIARMQGVHPSTILRQVRRFENRRDDPLVDCALGRLGVDVAARAQSRAEARRGAAKSGAIQPEGLTDTRLRTEALRILPLLTRPGAVLVVAPDMDRAVVLRDGPGGAERLAVLDRPVAEALALRNWITCRKAGRVAQYGLTPAGRVALKEMSAGQPAGQDGTRDADGPRKPVSDSPVAMLARRRDRDGQPFLAPALVAAAERLLEDFEIAQMGPRVTQDWDRFLSAGVTGGMAGGGRVPVPVGGGPVAARSRVQAALAELGPGLADVALRCCCYQEGLETAESRMGWSARSGKVVLRIALMRLRQHYDAQGDSAKMIG